MIPPDVKKSTREEREHFIRERFHCRSNCEICGMCQIFHGTDPEIAYKDYIDGTRDFLDVSAEWRR